MPPRATVTVPGDLQRRETKPKRYNSTVPRSKKLMTVALKTSGPRRPKGTSISTPPRVRPRRRPLTIATVCGTASLILPSVTLIRLYAISQLAIYSIIYAGIISGVTFLFYGYDKRQACNFQWRVREKTLHTLAAVGGWPGALVGMHYFQHKTQKVRFQVVFWGIVLGWEGVAWLVWNGGYR